jgi:thiamine pyrophosphokinase
LVRTQAELHGAPGDLVSLIPIGGDARGVTTEGLQYPLSDEPLLFGPARGLSNVLVGTEARVRVREGLVIIVHTHLRKGQR